MAFIDLTRQAKPAQVANQVLVTTAVSQSSGFYEWTQGGVAPQNIGTGSLNVGAPITASNIALTGDIFASSSFGLHRAITFPTGYMSGSVKILGDLIVEGSSSIQNTETFTVEDPIIDLNFTGSTALSSQDAGLRVGRVGSTNAQLLFDHSETRWSIDNAAGSLIHIVGASTTDTLTNKTITGLASSTMASAANLTFAGGGEVQGLPQSASLSTSATSKYYVDTKDTYLRKSFVKKAASLTNNTASFTAVTASAPYGMLSTNENDFMFFINGQYMEHDALTVKQNGSNFLLIVDASSIGYNLESDDEVLAFGKFDA